MGGPLLEPGHAHWLNNVVDRWALEEIVKKKSPLHEQDLAEHVSAHFSDVLQQIQDRDGMDEESSDEEADEGEAQEKGLVPA